MQIKDFTHEIIALLQNSPNELISSLQNQKTCDEITSFCKNEKILPTVFEILKDDIVLMPHKNKLIYIKNQYIFDFMKKLRTLIMILKKFNSENIDYVILKGLSTSCYYPSNEMRFFSDLDILVGSSDIKNSYKILKECGFRYAKDGINDSFEGSREYSRHLPEMVNDENVIIELHHRVTSPITYRKCPLANLCLEKKVQFKLFNSNINLLPAELCFATVSYHGIDQFKKRTDLRYLFDLKYIRHNILLSDDDLITKYQGILANNEVKKGLFYLNRSLQYKKSKKKI